MMTTSVDTYLQEIGRISRLTHEQEIIYACWWIRQGITRAISQQSRTVRIPIHVTEKLARIKKASQELSQKFGRDATIAELAQVVGLSFDQVRDYLDSDRVPISLNCLLKGSDNTEFGSLIEDCRASDERLKLQMDIEHLLSSLNTLQYEVIVLRFGLSSNGKLHSLHQIGNILNISREQVRLIERKALTILRKCFPDAQLYLSP